MKSEEIRIKNEGTRRGFSLVEMLVVIGIIAVLIAASLGGYSAITKTAERAKCREIVSQAATALATLYQHEGSWPRRLVTEGARDGKLNADCARLLAGYYSLRTDKDGKLTGYDKFGLISPGATDALRRAGKDASLATVVSRSAHGEKTIEDHLLHVAVDTDGDGLVENATGGGESVSVRATVIVWCAGKDGYMEPYTRGLKEDDVYSWNPGQTKKVK